MDVHQLLGGSDVSMVHDATVLVENGALLASVRAEANGLRGLVCFPEMIPGLGFESGYFRSLERRCGHGTEGEDDGGDHRVLA